MNNSNIKLLAVTIALAFSAGAMAQNVTKAGYKAGKERISAEYKTAKASCDSLAGNAKDICAAEAKGRDKVALADLEASYKPTEKNHYEVRVAKAEAAYGVAIQKCDDLSGTPKDVCVKEAKAAQVTAKADAKAHLKITDAETTANETSADAQSKANEKTSEARQDARVDKVDAQYTVAKEKCNTFAGNAKDSCLAQVKTRFGK
jgi:hypothetical protein